MLCPRFISDDNCNLVLDDTGKKWISTVMKAACENMSLEIAVEVKKVEDDEEVYVEVYKEIGSTKKSVLTFLVDHANDDCYSPTLVYGKNVIDLRMDLGSIVEHVQSLCVSCNE